MKSDFTIQILTAAGAEMHLPRLEEILIGSVEDGALISFVLPFSGDQARAYWTSTLGSVADGERLLICAMDEGQVIGTVQLYLSPEPNARHRAEVYKLLVHRRAQRRGVGSALMEALELEARRRGRSLLILDTVQGGTSERLYRRLGWDEIGVVPNHFVDPFGAPKASVYFMKHLAPWHAEVQ
ncbi:GNAT family N-acetyltransferase [Hoeflea sp. 108]|uniref:GNAT family N-acetyltransferase n=1 Tax=Hoeflea sp. 108 TaxID=1116369 RepID=UPI00036550FB|nr:GNAT family N-acetyltransferase [Hoeflea sp. 108]